MTTVLDSHVHFWDPNRLTYPWFVEVPDLDRSFLPNQLESLVNGPLDAVIFVEANCLVSQSDAELDFVDELVAGDSRICGYVANADFFNQPASRLRELAQRERVVGVRQNIQGHQSGFALEPEYVRGVQDAGASGLAFDICISADQMPEAIELVRRCPYTQFVLDHCGKPSIRTDEFEPWATNLSRLAEHPNVVCKVSGLFTEARHDQRNQKGLSRYIGHVISAFGAGRLLYGSDWPVVTAGGGEPAWRQLVENVTAGWAAPDRQAFFVDNAVRTYGVKIDAFR